MKPDTEGVRLSAIWNAIGGSLFAGQAAILLVFISRTQAIDVAGTVSIAYAIANLMYAFAKFGMRNFQITDTKESFSFGTYCQSRAVTILATACVAALLLWFGHTYVGYDMGKVVLIFQIVLLKLIDAAEDVVLARAQQVGHFGTGAKMFAIRQFMVLLVMCLSFVFEVELYSVFWIGLTTSLVLFAVLTTVVFPTIKSHKGARTPSSGSLGVLLYQCLPLCLGTTLSIYVGNMPKYAIDLYLDEHIQAIFGYLMLPAFVITLLNQFMYQPFVTDLAHLWSASNTSAFRKTVRRHCLVVTALAGMLMVCGLLAGLPLLSTIYNVNLLGFRFEFALLMIGGALYTLASYLMVPITTIRAQNTIAWGFGVSAVGSILLQGLIVPRFELLGASYLYVFSNTLLLMVLTVTLRFRMKS